MKIASIDIGTNAVKSKTFKTTPISIEFLDGKRSPFRLGTDVYNHGFLSNKELDKFIESLPKRNLKEGINKIVGKRAGGVIRPKPTFKGKVLKPKPIKDKRGIGIAIRGIGKAFKKGN